MNEVTYKDIARELGLSLPLTRKIINLVRGKAGHYPPLDIRPVVCVRRGVITHLFPASTVKKIRAWIEKHPRANGRPRLPKPTR